MKNNSKSLRNKIVWIASIINIFYLIIFLIFAFNPTGGWGNIEMYIYSIYFFPILILLVSFIFHGLKNKIIFNYLSFVIFGFLLIEELNLLSFRPIRLIGLFLLLVTPFILALTGDFIEMRFK